MKKIFNLTLLLLIATVSSYGQYDMGDAELNASLNSIVSKAKVNFNDFRHYVISNYGVTNNRYDYLESIMTVGDIYLAVEIEKITKKSLTDITTAFKRDKAKGWGDIAKQFGVTPGSPAFETLKDHAYKMANGKDRPKPKPAVKPTTKKPVTKPATKSKPKSTTKPKTKAATKSTTKPATKSTPKVTPKPKEKS